MAVHEHRHNMVPDLQFAISVRELEHGILTPLPEWMHLQSSGFNPYINNVTKYKIYWVLWNKLYCTKKARQMWADHRDKYAYIYIYIYKSD